MVFNPVICQTAADGMSNSVDLDQIASLIWVCTVCLDLSVSIFRIITAYNYYSVFDF